MIRAVVYVRLARTFGAPVADQATGCIADGACGLRRIVSFIEPEPRLVTVLLPLADLRQRRQPRQFAARRIAHQLIEHASEVSSRRAGRSFLQAIPYCARARRLDPGPALDCVAVFERFAPTARIAEISIMQAHFAPFLFSLPPIIGQRSKARQ